MTKLLKILIEDAKFHRPQHLLAECTLWRKQPKYPVDTTQSYCHMLFSPRRLDALFPTFYILLFISLWSCHLEIEKIKCILGNDF